MKATYTNRAEPRIPIPLTTTRIAGEDILYGCQPPGFLALAKLSIAVLNASGRMIANNPKLKNITAITHRAGASERVGTTLYIAQRISSKDCCRYRVTPTSL